MGLDTHSALLAESARRLGLPATDPDAPLILAVEVPAAMVEHLMWALTDEAADWEPGMEVQEWQPSALIGRAVIESTGGEL
jgi:hypothetical protein